MLVPPNIKTRSFVLIKVRYFVIHSINSIQKRLPSGVKDALKGRFVYGVVPGMAQIPVVNALRILLRTVELWLAFHEAGKSPEDKIQTRCPRVVPRAVSKQVFAS